MGILRFYTQLYKNSKKDHHAGLPETKFGAKYLKNMRNKVCSVASTNNNLNKQNYARYGSLYVHYLENLDATRSGCRELIQERGLSVQGRDR